MSGLDVQNLAGELQTVFLAGAFTPRARPVWEAQMGSVSVILKASCSLGFAAILLALIPVGRAQTTEVSGRYECTQAKVRGKAVPCNAAPLLLKSDGRFELRGWEGSYLVDGSWVELSDASVKSRAKIAPGHKIVFRYYGKHGIVEMTYERRLAELGKTSLS
jgi:hypothetical protein